MDERNGIINARAEANLSTLMKDGPRLRYDAQSWVVARDRTYKKILLGGLGCMGCGQMWSDDKGQRNDDPTFADAPEMAWPGKNL